MCTQLRQAGVPVRARLWRDWCRGVGGEKAGPPAGYTQALGSQHGKQTPGTPTNTRQSPLRPPHSHSPRRGQTPGAARRAGPLLPRAAGHEGQPGLRLKRVAVTAAPAAGSPPGAGRQAVLVKGTKPPPSPEMVHQQRAVRSSGDQGCPVGGPAEMQTCTTQSPHKLNAQTVRRRTASRSPGGVSPSSLQGSGPAPPPALGAGKLSLGPRGDRSSRHCPQCTAQRGGAASQRAGQPGSPLGGRPLRGALLCLLQLPVSSSHGPPPSGRLWAGYSRGTGRDWGLQGRQRAAGQPGPDPDRSGHEQDTAAMDGSVCPPNSCLGAKESGGGPRR